MNNPDKPLYTIENYRREESIGYLLGAAKARLVSALDGEMAEAPITATQWGILLQIIEGNAKTAADLCRNLSCDTGSMTRMLDRLEEKGLIRRERSTEDRRVVNIVPTEAGRSLPKELLPTVVKILNHSLRGFTADELEQFKGYLRRCIDNLQG
jgi:DNA-binding MarR family transcriptional regulator